MAFALTALVTNSTRTAFELLMNTLAQVIPSIISLLIAPLTNPEMLWLVAPLILTMILMQLYFARHKEEEGGWDNNFGNSLLLIFVSAQLLQYVINKGVLNEKAFLVIIIGLMSAIQAFINYYHLIQKRIALIFNSEITTNIIAYLSIILVYTDIPLSIATLIASVIMIISLFIFFNWLKKKIPMSRESLIHFKEARNENNKKRLISEKINLRNERSFDARVNDALKALIIIALTIALTFTVSLALNLLIQGLSYALISFYLMRKRGLKLLNLNYKGKTTNWLIGVLIGFLLFITISGIIYSLPINPNNAGLELLIPGLISAVSYEILFRGLMQRSLKAGMGYHAGINLQALMFTLTGLSTSSPITLPIFYVTGLILGYMREKTGLESTIAAHLTFNLLGMFL